MDNDSDTAPQTQNVIRVTDENARTWFIVQRTNWGDPPPVKIGIGNDGEIHWRTSGRLDSKAHYSLPFRKLQTYIEYKALLEGIEVRYLTKRETMSTSKKCHRCGYVTQVRGREFKYYTE